MKANEFVKKFGLDLAKRDVRAFESGFIKREDIVEHYGFDILDDLKRLVESHELVDKVGGMDKAKMLLRMRIAAELYDSADEIEKAIADVESCMEVSSESN